MIPWRHAYLLPAVLLTACTGLKNASEERPLFIGYDVSFTTPPAEDKAMIRAELEQVVTPQPNNSILGMRPTVALYNMTGEPKRPGKGLKNLLKYKIGSAPVYLDEVPLADVDLALVNRMNNRGHFSVQARHEVQYHGRRAEVHFIVDPGPVHRLRHILYADSLSPPADTDTLGQRIARARERSPLRTGEPYHLDALITERSRVASTLRNVGYYHLKDNDLEFAADTSVGDDQVDIRLRVKATTMPEARQRYRIGNVFVHGDRDAQLPANDTTVVDSLHYVDYLGMFRPSTITRGVFIQQGRPYSERRADLTRRYLSSYSVFSNVSIDHRVDSTTAGMLHADVMLVPLKRFSLYSELNAISKSNNFAGPGAKVGFKDRDLFRGAEVFTLDLNGRFEKQFAGSGTGTSAYEVGIKAALAVPRLLLLGNVRSARSFAPTTRFEAGYGLFRRIGLYGLESVNLSYGYSWRRNARVWHDVRFPDVSYNNLYYTSPEFDDFLDANPAIRRSFDEQFIIGAGYTYTRSSQRGKGDLSWWLISIGADEGGNLVSGFFGVVDGARPAEGYTVLGERYAQFVRFRPEVRWFQRIGTSGAQLATRVLASAAFPYGNSSTVPYVKQFYSGGTNSVRAFRARNLGPGTYTPTDGTGTVNGVLVDQVGDIKFEANMEYRFPIAGFMKGALFVDAGNVWLLNEDPQRPGGRFRADQALDELAIGAGAGLRFDPEVIVVRLDLATPLRRPDLPQGDRWVFDDQAPRLSDNFILNIAIGYPF
ncbi:MAG: BamA/TamA family outer membrane protein [Flavobacteriales bacterium]